MDGKVAVLTAAGVFNQRAGAVVDPLFRSSAFFDPRDLVQVKYEMVRRVLVDRVPVTVAAAAFGFSRASFYTAAAALQAAGPAGLVPGKPGPKGPRKLAQPVMDRVEQWRAADPRLKGRALARLIEAEFGFAVHPRSVERALRRRREPHDPESNDRNLWICREGCTFPDHPMMVSR